VFGHSAGLMNTKDHKDLIKFNILNVCNTIVAEITILMLKLVTNL